TVTRAVDSYLKDKVAVRAPAKSAEWLSTDGVKKYWKDSLPLRGSRTVYFMPPVGFDGIDYSLKAGDTVEWRGWTLQCLDAPGHARTQLAFLARKGAGPKVLFAGGAVAEPGKLFAPFTTDWDHWTDAGLDPTAKSLRRLAELGADVLCPSHGRVHTKDV